MLLLKFYSAKLAIYLLTQYQINAALPNKRVYKTVNFRFKIADSVRSPTTVWRRVTSAQPRHWQRRSFVRSDYGAAATILRWTGLARIATAFQDCWLNSGLVLSLQLNCFNPSSTQELSYLAGELLLKVTLKSFSPDFNIALKTLSLYWIICCNDSFILLPHIILFVWRQFLESFGASRKLKDKGLLISLVLKNRRNTVISLRVKDLYLHFSYHWRLISEIIIIWTTVKLQMLFIITICWSDWTLM